jgi:hypothetical protein
LLFVTFIDESRIEDITRWVKGQGLTTVAGVLLFALAYALGSGVSRIATDFLNDDDLRLDMGKHRFRIGVTEGWHSGSSLL